MTARASQLRAYERTTIRLLARGLGTADIARSMGVKPTTVRSTIRNIGAKWDTRDRDEIVTVARQLGILTTTEQP